MTLPSEDQSAVIVDIVTDSDNINGNINTGARHAPTPNYAGALVTKRGSFASVLAPLTQENFKQAVTDVEQRLRVVNQTLGLLNTDFDVILDEMLQAIRFKIGELLSADRTTIFLLDAEKNQLWSNVPKEGEIGKSIEIRIPLAPNSIAGEVALTKKTVNILYDFFDDPRSIQAKKQFDRTGYRTYTILAMPLLNDNGDLVAVVQLINKLTSLNPSIALEDRIDTYGFSQEDEALFAQFAPSMRLILESSQAFYVAAQKQRAAEALMQAAMSLGQSLDLETTLKKVMDEAKHLMNADRATLWLIDRDRHDLWTQIAMSNGTTKELRVPLGVGYAGHVAETGNVLNIPFDLYNHADSENSKKFDQANGYRTCSLLCMPVYNSAQELIGVTQLVNKRQKGDFEEYDPAAWPEAPEVFKASFNSGDEEFMKAFNVQAGVALENAKLFEKVKQEQQMQKDILRSLSDAVISTDKTGIIIAVNERAYELLGRSDLDPNYRLEGESIYNIIKIKNIDKDLFAHWFDAALEAKDTKSSKQYYPDQTLIPRIKDKSEVESEIESEHNQERKQERSVNFSINTMFDDEETGRVRGALVVMEDVSQEKRLKNTFYRYMTQEVAEQLLASGETKLGGKREEVSVLFSDIRSYTTITEQMQAEEVVEMLNQYFELMVDAVFKYKGTLDKYIGDAIMAVFGSPLYLEDHAWMSVQAAVEMRRILIEFNNQRLKQFVDKYGCEPATPEEVCMTILNIGIGINSDTVISGNIGSSKRMELTSIGDGVNLGSRLEGATKQYGCDIIISESTYAYCRDRIWVTELDRIRVKGKNKAISIYELVDLRSNAIPAAKQEIMEFYDQGREHYLDRQFASAMADFGKVLERDRSNKAASLHLSRCQHFLQKPPGDDWDGVWSLTEK